MWVFFVPEETCRGVPRRLKNVLELQLVMRGIAVQQVNILQVVISQIVVGEVIVQ
jgi:hypothetical protein